LTQERICVTVERFEAADLLQAQDAALISGEENAVSYQEMVLMEVNEDRFYP
jgi:hypothetical protein